MTAQPIVLVEDNPGDVELTRRALREARIANELVVASSGQEALDYIFGVGEHAEREPPAIVLLDLKLPGGMPGLEVLRRIRCDKRTELLPVIVLTSSREDEDVVGSYELGASAYVRKPLSFDKLVEVVKALSMSWILWNESLATRRGE